MKSTIINKKKVANIVAIALIAAIGVSLLVVSCTADTGNGIAPTNTTVIAGELEEYSDEPLLTAVEEVTLHETETETDAPTDENQIESSGASEIQPSATSQNTARSNGTSEKATSSTGSSGNSASAPSKRWVEDTQQVWVEDRAAWTEQVPVYSSKEVSICKVCGQDITGNTSAHAKAHMMAGEGSGHHSEVRKTVSGYNTVNHPAEGHYETKVVGGHWE